MRLKAWNIVANIVEKCWFPALSPPTMFQSKIFIETVKTCNFVVTV